MVTEQLIESVSQDCFLNFPLFEPLLPFVTALGPTVQPPTVARLNNMVNVDYFTFIEQDAKASTFEDGYEARIFLKHEIPTRKHSWHDFFNALVWGRFFNSKQMINRLHFHFQKSRYPHKQRLPAENMLTLFDENGAIVIATDRFYLDLIREHHWHELFWRQREMLAKHVKVIIFGHGLYEKALRPYIGLTAKCLMFVAQENDILNADYLVTKYLQEHVNSLHPSLLAPLPILGIPGWWVDNADEGFYQNRNYFRDRHTFLPLEAGGVQPAVPK